MNFNISIPHTIASLFGKSKPEELTIDEQQTLESVQTIAANRVKLVSYPNVEECHENYRVFCIKINPGMQLPKETRLFLLIHMQSSMAVVVSFDGVKSREHKWVHHNKKVEEGISRLEKCGLSLKDEALTRVAETVVTVTASPLDNAATGSQSAIEAASAWLARISADQTIFLKKQIVQAFQLLIDIFNPSSTLDHDAARQVGAYILKSLENKLQTIAMSPRQNSCQIEILSPNHEFYRMLALGNKQADKFMKALMGLFEPQLTSTQDKRQYHQFLAYSLSMSPRTILTKLLEYPHDDLFTDAVIVNNVLEDAIMATHQGKLTGAEVLALIRLLHDRDRLSFIEYPMIAPILKLFQQTAHITYVSARPNQTVISAASPQAAERATQSTSSTEISSNTMDETSPRSLYRSFCMSVCPRFSREEFKLYCEEANPFRNFEDLKAMLLQCIDTPLSAKLQPLLPWCNQLLASTQDRDQIEGRFIIGELLNGFDQLSATEQVTIRHHCAPYPVLTALLSSPQEEPAIAAAPVAVAIMPKNKNKTRTAAPAKASALPSLKLADYNTYYEQWKIKALNKWRHFAELITADDPGGFYPLIDDFYNFLMKHNLSDLQQNSPLMERLIETLLMESTLGPSDQEVRYTVFSIVGLAGHVKFFTFILSRFPPQTVRARGYYAMGFLCGSGTSRSHIECFAEGLAFGFDLNPDVKRTQGLIAALLSTSYGGQKDTRRLNVLRTMLNMLIDAGADLNAPCNRRGFHPLHIATCGGAHSKLIEQLLLRGASVSHVVSLELEQGTSQVSALDLALGLAKVHPDTGYANSVIKLIKRSGGKLQSGAHPYTIDMKVTQVDLSAAVLNQPSPFREIPQEVEMASAIMNELENSTNDFTHLNKLLKSHPDFYVETTLLNLTICCGREDLANFILRNLPCSPMRQVIDPKIKGIVTPLWYAAALLKNSTLQMLLEDGGNANDLNIKIDSRFVLTALHQAILSANPDGVKLLVDYGASIDSAVYLSPSNFSPVEHNGMKVFGPDLPYESMPIFQFAAEVGNHELGFMLLEHKQTGKFEVDDACRFRQAALRSDLATLKILAPQVDINSSPQRGKRNTALHLAYLRGWKEGVDFLVNEGGADQTKVNADGKLPRDLEPGPGQGVKGISEKLIQKLG